MLIGIDVDGVIAEFSPAYAKTASILLNKSFYGSSYGDSWHVEEVLGLSKEDADKVWSTVCGSGYANTLGETENSLDVIRRLAKKHRVSFITSPLKKSPTWGYDRAAWLLERFGDVAPRVVSTAEKYLVDVDVLIEDHAENLVGWLEERQSRGNDEAFGILYARPYNVAGMPSKHQDRSKRIDGWLEIEKFIEHWLPD